MQFSIYINQVAAVEWGLNLNQAAVFGFIYEAASWASKDGDYWNVSKSKIIEEFPLLTTKPDTIYRLVKVLVEKGLLDKKLIDGKDFYRVTEKGLSWNNSNPFPRVGKKSEQRKEIRDSSEKNPSKVGKKSDVSNNQISNNQISDCSAQFDFSSWPENADQRILADWFALRKQMRAPVSQTVINRFSKELHKANRAGYSVDHCLTEVITNGWRGFELQWLINRESGNHVSNQPILQQKPAGGFVEKHTDRSWAE